MADLISSSGNDGVKFLTRKALAVRWSKGEVRSINYRTKGGGFNWLKVKAHNKRSLGVRN